MHRLQSRKLIQIQTSPAISSDAAFREIKKRGHPPTSSFQAFGRDEKLWAWVDHLIGGQNIAEKPFDFDLARGNWSVASRWGNGCKAANPNQPPSLIIITILPPVLP